MPTNFKIPDRFKYSIPSFSGDLEHWIGTSPNGRYVLGYTAATTNPNIYGPERLVVLDLDNPFNTTDIEIANLPIEIGNITIEYASWSRFAIDDLGNIYATTGADLYKITGFGSSTVSVVNNIEGIGDSIKSISLSSGKNLIVSYSPLTASATLTTTQFAEQAVGIFDTDTNGFVRQTNITGQEFIIQDMFVDGYDDVWVLGVRGDTGNIWFWRVSASGQRVGIPNLNIVSGAAALSGAVAAGPDYRLVGAGHLSSSGKYLISWRSGKWLYLIDDTLFTIGTTRELPQAIDSSDIKWYPFSASASSALIPASPYSIDFTTAIPCEALGFMEISTTDLSTIQTLNPTTWGFELYPDQPSDAPAWRASSTNRMVFSYTRQQVMGYWRDDKSTIPVFRPIIFHINQINTITPGLRFALPVSEYGVTFWVSISPNGKYALGYIDSFPARIIVVDVETGATINEITDLTAWFDFFEDTLLQQIRSNYTIDDQGNIYTTGDPVFLQVQPGIFRGGSSAIYRIENFGDGPMVSVAVDPDLATNGYGNIGYSMESIALSSGKNLIVVFNPARPNFTPQVGGNNPVGVYDTVTGTFTFQRDTSLVFNHQHVFVDGYDDVWVLGAKEGTGSLWFLRVYSSGLRPAINNLNVVTGVSSLINPNNTSFTYDVIGAGHIAATGEYLVNWKGGELLYAIDDTSFTITNTIDLGKPSALSVSTVRYFKFPPSASSIWVWAGPYRSDVYGSSLFDPAYGLIELDPVDFSITRSLSPNNWGFELLPTDGSSKEWYGGSAGDMLYSHNHQSFVGIWERPYNTDSTGDIFSYETPIILTFREFSAGRRRSGPIIN